MDLLAGYSDNSDSESDESATNAFSECTPQVNNHEVMAWERASTVSVEKLKSKEPENTFRTGSDSSLESSSKVGGENEEWHKADVNHQSSVISSNKTKSVQPDSRLGDQNDTSSTSRSSDQNLSHSSSDSRKSPSYDEKITPRSEGRKRSRSSEKQKRSREKKRRSPGKKKRSRSRERKSSRSPDKRKRSRSRSGERSRSSRKWDRYGGRGKHETGRSGPQEQMRRQMQEQANKARELSGAALPKYYSLGGVNPLKYAEQEKKKKLLWGSKEKKDVPAPSYNRWEHTSFDKDSDGKMAAKFKKLMGIKESNSDSNTNAGGKDLLRKQSELFSTLDQQYEVARLSTHTQRGVGLGFTTSFLPKP